MISEDDILQALQAHAGIDAAQTGEAAMRAEVRRALATCPDRSRLLDPASAEWRALLETTLVPETWFFRNIEAYDALARWVGETWLPQHPGDRLRLLCLPCATGEEAYSLAISLLEIGMSPAEFVIHAGDISEVSLAKARQARYSRNAFRTGFDDARFGKFFLPSDGGTRQVVPKVRGLVAFQPMNLVDDAAPLPHADVIFCRNALIYFSQETQLAVVRRLHRQLSEDGLLFLGPVEPPIALQCGFSPAGFPMAFACAKSTLVAPKQAPARAPVPAKIVRPPAKPARRVHAVAAPRNISATPQFAFSAAVASIPPEDSLDRARSLADSGCESMAADMLDRLAAALSPTADFHCLRGVVREALGRSDLAEQDFRRALYLDPTHPEALAHLALLLELGGRPDAAAAFRRRSLRTQAS